MTISALTSGGSAISQVSQFSRVGSSSGSGDGAVRGAPPERRGEGGDFINAIASALSSIGVTSASSSSTGSTTDSSASDSGSDTSSSDPAQALGAFLHNLMNSLHAQNGGTAGASGQGEAPSGPPPAEGGGRRGPGDIESDLQSLIQSLASGSGASTTDSTSSASTASAGDSGSDALKSSFSTLLSALGGDGDSSSADSSSKLSSFLQALSNNLGGSSSSGNLINTSA